MEIVKDVIVGMVIAAALTVAVCMFFHFRAREAPLSPGEISVVAGASLVVAFGFLAVVKLLRRKKDDK
jgi:hypothetical protein